MGPSKCPTCGTVFSVAVDDDDEDDEDEDDELGDVKDDG